MEFQWDPLEFPNQIQSNPMKIPCQFNENLMKTNGTQWNSMEFPMRSKVSFIYGEIQEIASELLLTSWGGGGLLIRTCHYLVGKSKSMFLVSILNIFNHIFECVIQDAQVRQCARMNFRLSVRPHVNVRMYARKKKHTLHQYCHQNKCQEI